MKILLSNDDGVGAPGLSVLEEIAKKFTDDVTVIAPKSNMSGSGHSLTFTMPLRLTEHGDDHHFSVDGTPTDCVVMAVRHVMSERPDFMMSGINFDSNLAEDITYSGTVAAAMEATLLGIPAIAFSQKMNKDGSIDWEIARTYGPVVLKLIMEKFRFSKYVFLNVNFPSGSIDKVKGILVTKQGTRAIDDHVIMAKDPRGSPYFWIGPAEYRKNEDYSELDTDLGAVHSGYVSITPMSLDMTDRSSLETLKELFA
ncbi:MAG: 5'/3'-nucleotidase SurE [Holosporales bacterium]|jgi:5'-nucleotidase|nr:5'/3'-nucleotidase SurE [Holosporales bacterium]